MDRQQAATQQQLEAASSHSETHRAGGCSSLAAVIDEQASHGCWMRGSVVASQSLARATTQRICRLEAERRPAAGTPAARRRHQDNERAAANREWPLFGVRSRCCQTGLRFCSQIPTPMHGQRIRGDRRRPCLFTSKALTVFQVRDVIAYTRSRTFDCRFFSSHDPPCNGGS